MRTNKVSKQTHGQFSYPKPHAIKVITMYPIPQVVIRSIELLTHIFSCGIKTHHPSIHKATKWAYNMRAALHEHKIRQSGRSAILHKLHRYACVCLHAKTKGNHATKVHTMYWNTQRFCIKYEEDLYLNHILFNLLLNS